MGVIRDLVFGEGRRLEDAIGESDTFAAESITRSPRNAQMAAQRASWAGANSTDVWDMYDEIGELRNAVAKQGRIAGHVRFGIYKRSANGRPYRLDDNQLPAGGAMVLRALRSPRGGSRGLVQRYYEQIRVGGFLELQAVRKNGALIALHARSSEEIERVEKDGEIKYRLVRSNMALRTASSWSRVQVGDGVGGSNEPTPISRNDMLGQIWAPHPLSYDVPVSALWALRSTARNLILLQSSLTTRLNQRAVMSGIHAFKQGVDINVPSSAPDPIRNGSALDRLGWSLREYVRDPSSTDNLVGLILQTTDNPSEVYHFFDGMRELASSDIDLSERLLRRLITGMDVQEGTVMGRMEANHFSAWADDSDEMRSNIVPTLEDFYAALTHLVLWPNLQVVDRADYFIWGDLSTAQAGANQAENIRQGVAAGVVDPKAMARVAGVGEDEVAGTDATIRHVGQAIGDPVMMLHGLDGVPEDIKQRAREWSAKKTGPTEGAVESGRPKSQPGTGDPGSPDDDRSGGPRATRP